MAKIIKIIALCSAVLSIFLVQSCGKKNEKIVVISGSRTMVPMLGSLTESYGKDHNVAFSIQEAGSLKGLALLIDGKCDIASSSVKVPAAQLYEAQKKGILLKEYIIACDILVPIVHPSNSLKSLFQGQISDMYTGLIKDWKTVEGKPSAVIIVDRDEFCGTRQFMIQRFFESASLVEGSIKKKTDKDVVEYIAKHPAAIGYISKRCLNNSVKALRINGISATEENVEKGYYPLCCELYLYVNDKACKQDAKEFIEYSTGKTGQGLIEKLGFIPVSGMIKLAR